MSNTYTLEIPLSVPCQLLKWLRLSSTYHNHKCSLAFLSPCQVRSHSIGYEKGILMYLCKFTQYSRLHNMSFNFMTQYKCEFSQDTVCWWSIEGDRSLSRCHYVLLYVLVIRPSDNRSFRHHSIENLNHLFPNLCL